MKAFFGFVDTLGGWMAPVFAAIAVGIMLIYSISFGAEHIPETDPATGEPVEYASLVADIAFDIDQHYDWGPDIDFDANSRHYHLDTSGEQRPTLVGVAYADDVASHPSVLEECYTNFRHSHCAWHPRVRFGPRSRSITFRIYSTMNPAVSVATATVMIDQSLFDLHVLSGGPLVRGGVFHYDADPASLHLP